MVNTTCAVRECLSSSHKNKGLRFHQFPQAKERIEQWLDACSRVDLFGKSVSSLRHTYVCERHFEPRMYGKGILKMHAKPTLLLPPKHKLNATTQTEKLSLKHKLNNETTLVTEIDGHAIIARVYHYLDKEYELLKSLTNHSYDLSLLANTLKRTAIATGVSEQLITEILEQELSENDACEALAKKRKKVDCKDQPEAGSSKVTDIEELYCEGEDNHLIAEDGCDPLRSPSHDSSSDTTHDEVKLEIEEHPLELADDLIESTTNPADYASTPVLHTEVKIEPTDEENPQSSSSTHHVAPDPPPPAELKSKASGRNTNRALTAATKVQIVVMFGQKHSISDISRKLQISRKAVKHWLGRYRDSGDLDRLPPGPQPIVFTDASSIHREVVARHLSDPHASTRSTATALNLSMQTVRNHLRAAGLRSLLPAKIDPSKQDQPQISWQKVDDTLNHPANSNITTKAPTNTEINIIN